MRRGDDTRRPAAPGAAARFILSVLCGLALFPGSAPASTWQGDALLSRFSLAPWKLGPLRLEPQIILTDFGYDSNLYIQPRAVSDFGFTAGPKITAFLVFDRRIILTLSASPRYVYFSQTTRERAWNSYLDGTVSILLNRFFIQVGVHGIDARQRWNYEIDYRPRLKEIDYTASILWQRNRRTSFELSIRRSRYRYEDLVDDPYRIGELLDRGELRFRIAAYNQLTERTRAFVDFEYGRADFVNPANPRDSLSYAGYGGFEFSTLGRIRGRIRLGYKIFHPLAAGIAPYRGLVGDSSVSYSISRSLTLRAVYSRDVQFSTWFDNPYFIQNWAGAGISYYFWRRRFRLDYDYAELSSDYPILGSSAAAGNPRQDRLYMNTGGLFFRLGKDVSIGVRAGHLNRAINVYGWKLSRNFVALNLTYEF